MRLQIYKMLSYTIRTCQYVQQISMFVVPTRMYEQLWSFSYNFCCKQPFSVHGSFNLLYHIMYIHCNFYVLPTIVMWKLFNYTLFFPFSAQLHLLNSSPTQSIPPKPAAVPLWCRPSLNPGNWGCPPNMTPPKPTALKLCPHRSASSSIWSRSRNPRSQTTPTSSRAASTWPVPRAWTACCLWQTWSLEWKSGRWWRRILTVSRLPGSTASRRT